MTGFRFGRDARISSPLEFERIIAEGRKVVSPDLILWTSKQKAEVPVDERAPAVPAGNIRLGPRERQYSLRAARIGISITRKLGHAVHRNRLKRLLREAFRLNRNGIKPGFDLIAYPRPGCKWKSLGDAQESLLKSCRRAGIIQESR